MERYLKKMSAGYVIPSHFSLVPSLLVCIGCFAASAQSAVGISHASVDFEFDNATLVDISRGAPLSEEGYQRVAALRSNNAMKMFTRRVLRALGREVSCEGGFDGFVPHYSGVFAVQSFERLRKELQNARWTSPSHLRKHADALTGLTFTSLRAVSDQSRIWGTNISRHLSTRRTERKRNATGGVKLTIPTGNSSEVKKFQEVVNKLSGTASNDSKATYAQHAPDSRHTSSVVHTL